MQEEEEEEEKTGRSGGGARGRAGKHVEKRRKPELPIKKRGSAGEIWLGGKVTARDILNSCSHCKHNKRWRRLSLHCAERQLSLAGVPLYPPRVQKFKKKLPAR